MIFAKTIKLFLIDGSPNGRVSCELSNWSGKAYKIPRVEIKNCADRDDLFGTGVYLLFGKDETENNQVYIGEAECILKRLNQQLAQKQFWSEAIVFISKDDNLNKAHIKYLENRLHEIADVTKRYKVENSITPTQSSISESDKAEMEEYLDNVKMLVNTLGHKVFEEKRVIQKNPEKNIFHINAARGAKGQAQPTVDGFVVLKGSQVARSEVPSISPSFVVLRQKLLDEGVLGNQNDEIIFMEDYIFGSPSTAASVLMGRNANGLTEWKNQRGVTLKEFEESK